ncbi:hypothetical protein OT109_03095 [Phycisphaeraceae bacterium D3-23]
MAGCGSESQPQGDDAGADALAEPVTTTIDVLGSLQEVGQTRPQNAQLREGETMIGGQGPTWSGASARVSVTNQTDRPIANLTASLNAMVPGLHARRSFSVVNPWEPPFMPGETRYYLVNLERPYTPSPSSGSGTATVTTRGLTFVDDLQVQSTEWFMERAAEQAADEEGSDDISFFTVDNDLTDKQFMLMHRTGEDADVLNVNYFTREEADSAAEQLEALGLRVHGLPDAE